MRETERDAKTPMYFASRDCREPSPPCFAASSSSPSTAASSSMLRSRGEDYPLLSTLKEEKDSLLKLQEELEQKGDVIVSGLLCTLVSSVIINGVTLLQSDFSSIVGLTIAVSMTLVSTSLFASTAYFSFYKLERLGFSFEEFNNRKKKLIEKFSRLQGSYVPPPAPPQVTPLQRPPQLRSLTRSPSPNSTTLETPLLGDSSSSPLLPSDDPHIPTPPSPAAPEPTRPQGLPAPSPSTTLAPSPRNPDAAQLNSPASNEFYLRVDKLRRTFERAANLGKFQIQYRRSFWGLVGAGFIHSVLVMGFLLCRV